MFLARLYGTFVVTCLDDKTCYPKHVTTNVPYNLAKRICRITIKEETERRDWNNLANF